MMEVDANTFMFIFPDQQCLERVATGGTWAVNGKVLLLKPWVIGNPVKGVQFESMDVWVQLSNIPFHLMLKPETGRMIMGEVGEVLDADNKIDSDDDGNFIRVRCRLPISDPLPRGIHIEVHDEELWIDFKFERVPSICCWCGRMTHEGHECEIVPKETQEAFNPGYGPFLLCHARDVKHQRNRSKPRSDAEYQDMGREEAGGGDRTEHDMVIDDEEPATLPDQNSNTEAADPKQPHAPEELKTAEDEALATQTMGRGTSVDSTDEANPPAQRNSTATNPLVSARINQFNSNFGPRRTKADNNKRKSSVMNFSPPMQAAKSAVVEEEEGSGVMGIDEGYGMDDTGKGKGAARSLNDKLAGVAEQPRHAS